MLLQLGDPCPSLGGVETLAFCFVGHKFIGGIVVLSLEEVDPYVDDWSSFWGPGAGPGRPPSPPTGFWALSSPRRVATEAPMDRKLLSGPIETAGISEHRLELVSPRQTLCAVAPWPVPCRGALAYGSRAVQDCRPTRCGPGSSGGAASSVLGSGRARNPRAPRGSSADADAREAEKWATAETNSGESGDSGRKRDARDRMLR